MSGFIYLCLFLGDTMLLTNIDQYHRDRLSLLASDMGVNYHKQLQYGSKPLENEINLYTTSDLLPKIKNQVIDHYFALSAITLKELSYKYHFEENARYDRLMSAHESLIHKILNQTHKIHFIRQLLIGGTHCDIYIPRIHLCIEPSSIRYFSQPARAKAEAIADYERHCMNGLFTWRTEDYKRSNKDLGLILDNLALTMPRLTSSEVTENFYSMAVRTLPRFITYGSFCHLMKTSPPFPYTKDYLELFLDRT